MVTSEIHMLERVLQVGVAMVTSEIYLLEPVLRVGVAMVTSEIKTDFYLVSSGIQSCNLSVTSPTL